MNIENIILIIIGIVSLIFSIIVLFKSPSLLQNKIFSLLSFLAVLWTISIAFFRTSKTPENAFVWNKLIYFTGLAIPPSFFYFSKLFQKTHFRALSVLALVATTTTLLISILFTEFFVKEISITDKGNHAVLGPFYSLWILWFGILMTLGFLNLFKTFRSTKGKVREQTKYFLLATVPSVILSVPFNMLLPFFGNYKLIWIGPIGIALMLSIMTYAIIKHRFLGIKFVIGKFLHYLLRSVTLLLFLLITFFLKDSFSNELQNIELAVYMIILSLIYVFIFTKIDNLALHFFEDTIIYSDYNPSDTINKLQKITTSEMDINKIIKHVFSIIRQSFNSQKVGIVIFINDSKRVLIAKMLGFEKSTFKNENHIKNFWKKVTSYNKEDKTLVYDEITFQSDSKKATGEIKRILNFMKNNGIEILIPLSSKESLQGFVIIGPKQNKAAFTVQDIDLLEDIVENASATIARFISSSILYSDVKTALKYLSSLNLLKNSRLLRLKQVQELAKQKNISKIEALRETISSAIEYFKPKDDNRKRTAARLKYEILEMIAFEGATESQIMWDLGFDVYTRSVEEKLGKQREPRFKLKDASEYSATSDRSFKRLKKEAVEMLRWKLESGEK